jgi:hypothetical protein
MKEGGTCDPVGIVSIARVTRPGLAHLPFLTLPLSLFGSFGFTSLYGGASQTFTLFILPSSAAE